MKNQGTWILFSFVVLLAAYAYFGEYKGKEKEKVTKDQQALILKDMNKDQINSIEINNLEQKLILSRDTNGWLVTAPVSDSADSNAIDSWLKTITEEKSTAIAVEGTDIQWKYFGFDQPAKSITLKTTSNRQQTVEVSGKKNFEGNTFIRMPGNNRVLVAGSSWSDYVSKKVFDVRNKSIFRHQISNVQKILIKNKKATIEIENKEAKWISATQPDWTLDQNAIRELITKIGEMKAIEFIAEKDQLGVGKRKHKLGTSDVSIDIKLSNGEWSANLYQSKEKAIYVEVPAVQLLVKIGNDVFDRLDRLNLSQLRDFKLPFAGFDKAKVEKLAYETTLKKANLVKKGTQWEMENPEAANEVQQEKVSLLLDTIKNLVATQYLTKSELKKDISKQKVLFKDGTDQIYFELQFSDSEKKKINDEEKTVRYAKTNLYPEAFLVEESEFEKLSLNEIIKSKVSAEGKSLSVEPKKDEKNAR